MRERVVIVPKNLQAEIELDSDEASDSQLFALPIVEEDFHFLCQSGIIDIINISGEANIDDFEDDSVRGTKNLKKVIKALTDLDNSEINEQQQILIGHLVRLFTEGLKRNTGVYFYL